VKVTPAASGGDGVRQRWTRRRSRSGGRSGWSRERDPPGDPPAGPPWSVGRKVSRRASADGGGTEMSRAKPPTPSKLFSWKSPPYSAAAPPEISASAAAAAVAAASASRRWAAEEDRRDEAVVERKDRGRTARVEAARTGEGREEEGGEAREEEEEEEEERGDVPQPAEDFRAAAEGSGVAPAPAPAVMGAEAAPLSCSEGQERDVRDGEEDKGSQHELRSVLSRLQGLENGWAERAKAYEKLLVLKDLRIESLTLLHTHGPLSSGARSDGPGGGGADDDPDHRGFTKQRRSGIDGVPNPTNGTGTGTH
ncbi:unnamed protein product, partial [Scytosiphon promiscuus]